MTSLQAAGGAAAAAGIWPVRRRAADSEFQMGKGKADQSPEAISIANEEAKQEIQLAIAKMCHSHGSQHEELFSKFG